MDRETSDKAYSRLILRPCDVRDRLCEVNALYIPCQGPQSHKFLTHPKGSFMKMLHHLACSKGLGDEISKRDDLFKSSNPNLRVHITPAFEGAVEFPWLNKPKGIAHWLENAEPPVTQVIISCFIRFVFYVFFTVSDCDS